MLDLIGLAELPERVNGAESTLLMALAAGVAYHEMGRMTGYGHQGTKQIRTIAVELGHRDSAEDLAQTKQVSATMGLQGRPRTRVIVHTL